ncbi:hypothetical protein P9112_002763 [Eukaryota sp. TZLM1-RC]
MESGDNFPNPTKLPRTDSPIEVSDDDTTTSTSGTQTELAPLSPRQTWDGHKLLYVADDKKYCRLCRNPASMSVKTSQSSLKYHLDKFHPSWREKTRSAQPILNSFVRRKLPSLGLTSDERKEARRQLIRLIILECLPLGFVESPEFRSLLNFYNSSAESISRRTLAREIGKQHNKTIYEQ